MKSNTKIKLSGMIIFFILFLPLVSAANDSLLTIGTGMAWYNFQNPEFINLMIWVFGSAVFIVGAAYIMAKDQCGLEAFVYILTLLLIVSFIGVARSYFDSNAALFYILFLIMLGFIFRIGKFISKEDSILKGRFVAFALGTLSLVIIILIAHHTIILNGEQKNIAEKAAQISLRNDGWCDTCEVDVGFNGWITSTANGDQKVTQVTFTKGEIIIYLDIDLDNGAVVKKRQKTVREAAYDASGG